MSKSDDQRRDFLQKLREICGTDDRVDSLLERVSMHKHTWDLSFSRFLESLVRPWPPPLDQKLLLENLEYIMQRQADLDLWSWFRVNLNVEERLQIQKMCLKVMSQSGLMTGATFTANRLREMLKK